MMDEPLRQVQVVPQQKIPQSGLRRGSSWEAGLFMSDEFRYDRLVHVYIFPQVITLS